MFDNSNSNATLKSGHAPAIAGTELGQTGLTREDVVSRQAHDVDQRFPLTGKPQPDATVQVSVKPVDRKTITGSYAGDSRSNPGDVAKSSLNQAADNGGPRARMGQFVDNKKITNNLPAENFPGNLADSDAGN